ncbi:hypothetical protein [Pyxidicoccus xibeiensis]|uniref:hypothetical protein n=1 Tax=Pyxidicoccus xibeiensis TaxID=2906759 RepID=UPI0020A7E025|nr:hypothetical protein [Pyxidicoccus xibeiensis]MCP3142924.1 hypothetical protein [Pyxidicoccus xibeiensis]
MLNPHDRRDLACLGLMVLVYGLAVSPVLHAVVGHGGGLGGTRARYAHVHDGEGHTHGEPERPVHTPGTPDEGGPANGHGPDGHQHLTGSVEHLHAMAASWVVTKLPRVRGVTWWAEVPRPVSFVTGAAPRPTAMPQGP